MDEVCVKVGEYVQRGQVVGLNGSTGQSTGPHIHYQYQDTKNGSSTPSSFADIGNPTGCDCGSEPGGGAYHYTSANTPLFDAVFTASGGSSAFGQTIELSEYGWWDSWTSGDYANVYLTHPNQSIQGGSLANPHIVYDAMRGARKAVLCFGQMFGKWSAMNNPGAGPNSYLAAPIDSEYVWAGYTLQDCQGGYIRWNGSVAEDFPYPEWFGPGAFDPSGGLSSQQPELLLQNLPQGNGYPLIAWSPTASYLFVECYKKNGMAANLGWAYAGAVPGSPASVHKWNFTWPGGQSDFYWVQNFDDGAYGDCIIMYDPDNAGSTGFTPADGLNKARLIRGNIWITYRNNNWISILGAPVNNQHGSPGNIVQEFQLGVVTDNGSTVTYSLYSAGLASLHISSDPEGGAVLVDDAAPYTGATTPTVLFADDAGNHVVRIALEGQEQIVNVSAAANVVTEVSVSFNEQQGSISVITPNGGAYPVSSTLDISWSGFSGAVQIDLSRDGGQNWESMQSWSGSQTYSWEVTGSESDECLIKVYELGNSSNYDVSNGFFTIGDPNDPPAAQSFPDTVVYRNPLVIDLTSKVSDTDGTVNWNTLSVTSSPDGNSVVNSGAHTVTFTPSFLYFGSTQVKYTVQDNDGAVSNEGTVTINVQVATSVIDNGDFQTQSLPPWFQESSDTNDADINYGYKRFGPGDPYNSTHYLFVYVPPIDQFGFGQDSVTILQSGLHFEAGSHTITFDGNRFARDVPILFQLFTHDRSTLLWSGTRIVTSQTYWDDYSIGLSLDDPVVEAVLKLKFGPVSGVGAYCKVDDISLDGELSKRIAPQDEASESSVPKQFALYQNHPNPFNPTTTFRFDLPEQAHVRLAVYNIIGQKSMMVIDGEMDAGAHSVIWDASQLPSGVYFYTLEAGSFLATKKLVLLK
ncbi:hypothetical protein A3I42_00710 [Candidatus Uhrbacteria bacterium RIFCSPLOWO2_02_FULL_49_11]|uniref:M23ase beta-sheet core domain-containing protein n=1 Tax=Candidatus Uhrbacteria bacterium RIFCSPLOWO2_02_FULL_49_11 TaxID=1802409 RepID=A0A1F7VER6_9BACT|nr:MAG: hypothetical protein A3I42_00710 [Candidatus Uhrbacteria bacterium RIFCSPLOWO2_02_FULL_49_11]